MVCIQIQNGIVCEDGGFKPGDPPPAGYNAWHKWAEIQYLAGLRQEKCGLCGKWKFPQEMSNQVIEYAYSKTKHGPKIYGKTPVYKGCSSCP